MKNCCRKSAGLTENNCYGLKKKCYKIFKKKAMTIDFAINIRSFFHI